MADIKTFETKKTGNTFVHTPNDPATLPVPQQILLSEFSVITRNSAGSRVARSSMQERELKVLFFLLHTVYDELEPGKTHEIDMYKVHDALRTQYGIADKSIKWVWDSVQTLSRFTVEWIDTRGDERWECIGSLINHAETNQTARDSGILRFRFYNELVPVLKEQSRFSRMRLHFLMSLSGKYSIILYGILEGFANQKHSNTLTVNLEDLRKWLKIDPEQYKKYNDLKRFAVDPAIKQINKDPEKSGLTVSYSPKKRGKKVIALEFTVEKDHTRTVIDADFKKQSKLTDKHKSQEIPPSVNPFNLDKLSNMLKNGLPGHDKYALIQQYEPEFRKWLHGSGKSDTVKSFEAVFVKFLKNKEQVGEL